MLEKVSLAATRWVRLAGVGVAALGVDGPCAGEAWGAGAWG